MKQTSSKHEKFGFCQKILHSLYHCHEPHCRVHPLLSMYYNRLYVLILTIACTYVMIYNCYIYAEN